MVEKSKHSIKKETNNKFKQMKIIFKTVVMLMTIAVINGCSKKDDDAPIVNQDIGISPDSGPRSTVVAITGITFGTDPSKVKVFFNGKEATVQSVTDSQVEAIVPTKAGTGNVKVMIDGADNFGPEFTYTLTGVVSTLAGEYPAQGYVDATGANARFNKPAGIAMNAQGDLLIADMINRRIRKVTKQGVVTTFSGGAQGYVDGTLANAKFMSPKAIAIDKQGNGYIADRNRIRKITPDGMVSTLAGGEEAGFADGKGAAAIFKHPTSIAIDNQGNIYVAGQQNHRIRKITQDGTVSSIGNASGLVSSFDLAGNESFVPYRGYEDGDLENAKFEYPKALATDTEGNVYVIDGSNENTRIRKITAQGNVSTITELNSDSKSRDFEGAWRLTTDKEGNLYVSERKFFH